jgi:hypothetical protein
MVGVLGLARAAHAEPIPTTLTKQDYDNHCRSSNVPLPPPWGDTYPNPNPWIFNGWLETDTAHNGLLAQSQAYLSSGFRGFIYYYPSTSPAGLCMMVVRETVGPGGVNLGGMVGNDAAVVNMPVICQGTNGKACFWDSDEYPFWDACNGSTDATNCPNNLGGTRVFDSTVRHIASQNLFPNEYDYNSDASNPDGLIDSTWYDIGGIQNLVCTDCHSGENVFINHPGTATDLYGQGRVARNLWFPSSWPDPIVPAYFNPSRGPDTSADIGIGTAGANAGDTGTASGGFSCQSCHSPNTTGRSPGWDGGRLPKRDAANFSQFGSTVLNQTVNRALIPGAPYPNNCDSSNHTCPNGAMPNLPNGYSSTIEEWSNIMYDTHSKDGVIYGSGAGPTETNETEQHFSWTSDGMGQGQLSTSPYTTTMWNYAAGYCFVSKLNPGHAANDVFMALDGNNAYVLGGVHDTTAGHARARIDATCVPWTSLLAANPMPATPGQVWNPGAEPSFQSGLPVLPSPKTGSASLFSPHSLGQHSHSFTGATATMPSSTNFGANDTPYLWVNLVSGDLPTEVMLELTATDGTVTRAYWGSSNPISLPAFSAGALPAAGAWTKLTAAASKFLPKALTGKRANGMKVYFYGGSGYVDDVGFLVNGSGSEMNPPWVDDALPAGAVIGGPGTATSAVVTQINCGGPLVAPFAADIDFSGGSPRTRTNTIDLNGAVNPAPVTVYQSQRFGDFTYTIGGYAPGSMNTVRLHFADTHWTTTNTRIFNVDINGVNVLQDLDIVLVAGGGNKALIKEFMKEADSSGRYVIKFSTTKDAATVSGIEVIRPAGGLEQADGWVWAMKPSVGWSNSAGQTGTITTTLPANGWDMCQISGLNGAFPSSGTLQNITLAWPKAATGVFSNSGNNWVVKQTASTSAQRIGTMCADFNLQQVWQSGLATSWGFSVYTQGLDISLTQATNSTMVGLKSPFGTGGSFNIDSNSICSIVGLSGMQVSTSETSATANVAIVDRFSDSVWVSNPTGPGSWYATCYQLGGYFD